MFGYPCELDELRELAERNGLTLIEDAAEAVGAEYKGRPLGSHGPSAVFGFYPNKQMATGEGGVATGAQAMVSAPTMEKRYTTRRRRKVRQSTGRTPLLAPLRRTWRPAG